MRNRGLNIQVITDNNNRIGKDFEDYLKVQFLEGMKKKENGYKPE
jgi:hypothetical protein